MFKVYNKRAVTRQQRFQNALVSGIAATIGITLIYGLISYFLNIEFSIVYLAAGYAIGYVIKKYGRGVQLQFAVLAAVCAFFCFLIGDMIAFFGFEILLHPAYWFFALQLVLSSLLSASISSILSLLFRLGGIYLAFSTARVL